MCLRHNSNQHIHHVCYQNMGDSLLCLKADLMHFAPMEIHTVGVSWRQIKAVDRSNPEPFPLAVPPTIHSPFLSMCGKGWLRPSSDSYAHTSNHCHQSKRKRWKVSEFRKRNSTVESGLQIIFIFACAKSHFRTKAEFVKFLILFLCPQILILSIREQSSCHVCFIILFCLQKYEKRN